MTAPHFTIRSTTPEDDDAIGALLSGPYHDDPHWLASEITTIRQTFTNYGDLAPGYLHWVAVTHKNNDTTTTGDSVIGVLEATIRLFANGCDTIRILFLEGIAVAPAYQRDGVATALMETATRWALANGISEMGSDCEIDNLDGQNWHASMGFKKAETVINYVKKIG